MRLIYLLLVSLLAIITVNGQEQFYYTPKGKIYLNDIDKGKIVVKFKNDLSISKKMRY